MGLLRDALAEMQKQEPWNMLRSYAKMMDRISAALSGKGAE